MKKFLTLAELKKIRQKFSKKKIGLAHGAFDLFHLGHLRHLKKAKELCDILVVSITTKKFISKGIGQPFYNDTQRLEILNNIEIIDYLAISNYRSSVDIIKALKPNFYFKGSEYENLKSDISKKIIIEKKLVEKNDGKIIFTNEKTFSSSKILNNFFKDFDDIQKNYIKNLKKKISIESIIRDLEKISKKRILVIGDIIFDKYIFSDTLGKSPKESIISVKVSAEKNYSGGILATANHLVSFCKNITLLSIAGEKEKKLINKNESLNRYIKKKIFFSNKQNSIYKCRFLNNQNEKIFQYTNRDYFFPGKKIENKICLYLNKNIKKFDAVIVNDFGHGLLTDKIIKIIQNKSKELCLNVQTNSANSGFNLVNKYKKANYVVLDEPETRLALQKKFEDAKTLFLEMKKILKFKIFCISFGSSGAKHFDNKKIFFSPALTNKTLDTMGAGDAFFAISSLFSLVRDKNKTKSELILFTGNIAGAMKTQYLGHSNNIKKLPFLNYAKSLLS